MSTSDAEDPRRFSEAARRIGTGKQRDTSSLVNPASSSSPTVNPASYKEEAENPAECNETGEHDAMGMSLRYSAVYSQHDNDEEAVVVDFLQPGSIEQVALYGAFVILSSQQTN